MGMTENGVQFELAQEGERQVPEGSVLLRPVPSSSQNHMTSGWARGRLISWIS
jgi:hypothetical protein